GAPGGPPQAAGGRGGEGCVGGVLPVKRPSARERGGTRGGGPQPGDSRHKRVYARLQRAMRGNERKRVRRLEPSHRVINVPAPWSVSSSSSTACGTLPSRMTTPSTPASSA